MKNSYSILTGLSIESSCKQQQIFGSEKKKQSFENKIKILTKYSHFE